MLYETDMPDVYVIVPVYKTEKYLRRCVDSLLCQTYKNVIVILVDDGSPDNCPNICDEYQEKNDNVKVIHQENAGQSGARNAGLDWLNQVGVCEKETVYIGFVDSDDWVADDMYETMVNLAVEHNAECVQVGYMATSSENASPCAKKILVKAYTDKEVLQHYLSESTVSGSYSVCRCLFRAEILQNIRFRAGKINEDIDYKYMALSKCHRMVNVDKIEYFYRQATGSTTTDGLKRRDYDLYEAADALWELCKDEEYGTIRKLAAVKKARTAFSLLCRIAYYGISDPALNRKETIKKLKTEHRRNLKTLLDSPIPISRKMLSIMFAMNYSITEKAIRLAKKFRK